MSLFSLVFVSEYRLKEQSTTFPLSDKRLSGNLTPHLSWPLAASFFSLQ